MHSGFTLKTEGTTWVPVADNHESFVDAVRFAPKDSQMTGSLSVRTDKMASNVSLETYAKKFMRDYPNYGFDVLGSKTVAINQSMGLVVDMIQKTKNKQLRQVILKRNSQVAIITCLDDKEYFLKTIVSCNQIIKSFEWTPENATPPPTVKAEAKTKVQ